MNNDDRVVDRLAAERLVAVIRTGTSDAAVRRALDAVEAGIGIIEVAWTTPQAADAIRRLVHLPLLIGAGTITSATQAEEALDAGAQFLVAPNFSSEVAEVARRRGIFYIPGVWTPGEVATAMVSGCSVLKLFPAVTGGIAHLRALKEPFPQIRWMPTGGIDWDTAEAWLQAGALAVGMGSALFNAPDLKASVFQIRERHS